MTGGGGNVGSIVTQLIFFRGTRFSKETGIVLMGVMMLACTLPVSLIYFPQWGGMLAGGGAGKGGASEEAYYLSEWREEEKEKGLHHGSLKFASNSQGERGRRVSSVATPPPETTAVAGV